MSSLAVDCSYSLDGSSRSITNQKLSEWPCLHVGVSQSHTNHNHYMWRPVILFVQTYWWTLITDQTLGRSHILNWKRLYSCAVRSTLFLHGVCMSRECIYGEWAHEQHVRRTLTLTLTHTITVYSVSGNVVCVRILVCAARQKPCRKRVYHAVNWASVHRLIVAESSYKVGIHTRLKCAVVRVNVKQKCFSSDGAQQLASCLINFMGILPHP